MELDAFIPLYGNELLGAVEGFSNAVLGAYVRALWYYWSQTKCSGLDNEPHVLRSICRVHDDVEWEQVEPVIFGRFFKLGHDGRWHQKRADEEWKKAKGRTSKARSAADIRWKIEHERRKR